MSERDEKLLNDIEFINHIIDEIRNYAVTNGLDPDDTLEEIADIIKSILE